MEAFLRLINIRTNEPPQFREIIIGKMENIEIQPHSYPSNQIISSKYTLWNFLPKNLFEQFSRLANFYFLVVTIILIVIDAPVSPVVSILPLVFVISIGMIKQGYEDWLRHKADSQVNNSSVHVIVDGKLDVIQSYQIRVGDIVQVFDNEEIPCDLVLLSTSQPDGGCYVTTANLDGESNLKSFFASTETNVYRENIHFRSLEIHIQTEQPKPDLYKFNGRFTIQSDDFSPKTRSLSAENFVLRGCSLKNTEYIYGVALYTGIDTKMALNSKQKPHKMSTIESILNWYLIFCIIVLVVESLISTIAFYVIHKISNVGNAWYLNAEAVKTGFFNYIETFLAFSTLLNYIIPISLYVTIEMQKFFGALLFMSDKDMYCKEVNQGAKANTSDLNEDLGQIEYIFTDKTGTLTENEMNFRQCSVNCRHYFEIEGNIFKKDDGGMRNIPLDNKDRDTVRNFFRYVALCHTVYVNKSEKDRPGFLSYEVNGHTCWLEYQGSSPDEKALLEAAFRFGVVYTGLDKNYMVLLVHGKEERYLLHHLLEFDATRKRMSAIVQSEKGELLLLCKGAETHVLPRCSSGPVENVMEQVMNYAEEGLRTLVYSDRNLTESEFNTISKKLDSARCSIYERDEALDEAFDFVENNLNVVACTGVEDRLQDGVQETIVYLRHAGIKIWVLTGDKIETARNISFSSGHFQSGMQELTLVGIHDISKCRESLDSYLELLLREEEPRRHAAFTIDGMSLALVMHDKFAKTTFLKIGLLCQSVLCCRLSPIQKSQVVSLVKSCPLSPVTLAIGDGANDVSMIQEAHVGIGVMGKEGRQAVRSSDYAFAKFRFLRKCLLVHGQWFYNRISILILYFFYKNFVFMNCQLFYQFFTLFSGQTLYMEFALTFYNIFFTALPILLFGVFEQHYSKTRLLQQPSIYAHNIRNAGLKPLRFAEWILISIWHSAVLFAGCFWFQKDLDNFTFGFSLFVCLIVIANLKLAFHTQSWTWLTILGYVLTFITFVGMSCIYSGVFWDWLQGTYEHYWIFFTVVFSPQAWICCGVVVFSCFIVDSTVLILQAFFTKFNSKEIQPLLPSVQIKSDEIQMSPLKVNGQHSSVPSSRGKERPSSNEEKFNVNPSFERLSDESECYYTDEPMGPSIIKDLSLTYNHSSSPEPSQGDQKNSNLCIPRIETPVPTPDLPGSYSGPTPYEDSETDADSQKRLTFVDEKVPEKQPRLISPRLPSILTR